MNILAGCYRSYLIITSLLACLVYLGNVEMIGAAIILVYWTSIKLFTFSSEKYIRLLSFVFLFLISIGLINHAVPGFHNILYYKGISVSDKSAPYSAYINFDKPFLALLLIYHYNKRKLYETKFVSAVVYGLLLGIVAASILSFAGVYSQFIKFDPKIPEILPNWIMMNMVVAISEEAFFRGLIQNSLYSGLAKIKALQKYSGLLSLIISSLFFSIACHAGDPIYTALAFIAGLFYGYALLKTGMIESSIIVHLMVNLVHITLFTYPYMI